MRTKFNRETLNYKIKGYELFKLRSLFQVLLYSFEFFKLLKLYNQKYR